MSAAGAAGLGIERLDLRCELGSARPLEQVDQVENFSTRCADANGRGAATAGGDGILVVHDGGVTIEGHVQLATAARACRRQLAITDSLHGERECALPPQTGNSDDEPPGDPGVEEW